MKVIKVRYFQYTAIDDATRIRALKIYKRHTQQNAIDFLDYVIAKFPFRILYSLERDFVIEVDLTDTQATSGRLQTTSVVLRRLSEGLDRSARLQLQESPGQGLERD